MSGPLRESKTGTGFAAAKLSEILRSGRVALFTQDDRLARRALTCFLLFVDPVQLHFRDYVVAQLLQAAREAIGVECRWRDHYARYTDVGKRFQIVDTWAAHA